MSCANITSLSSPQGQKSSIKPWNLGTVGVGGAQRQHLLSKAGVKHAGSWSARGRPNITCQALHRPSDLSGVKFCADSTDSNWIFTSGQPRRVISGRTNSVISKNVNEDLRRMVMIIISLLISFFIVFNRCLSVVLKLDKGDYPKNVQVVCLSHNK